MQELETVACGHSSQATCKKEMLYHKWSSRVFAPLYSQISAIMGGSKFTELEKEKRRLFLSYITCCNEQVELREIRLSENVLVYCTECVP